jgi:SAM-dependent methyltransferase
MTSPTEPASLARQRIVDYDSGFDYCAFWGNRDYEQWVEARTLRRLLPRLRKVDWFADFGGGYGRNAIHYQGVAEHVILLDYSVTQLTRAAERLAPEIQAGRVHLIRADLGRLPLIDSAVDAAIVVRVLHHLGDVDRCLTEMARAVAGRWLVDVPIKHHILGRVRGIAQGRFREIADPQPVVSGSTEYPFWTFQLRAIRSCLLRAGFRTQIVASVNNLRRWDQVLPHGAVAPLRPVAYVIELAAQRMGRGWWGPSQFLLAARNSPQGRDLREAPNGFSDSLAGLARRLQCPSCRSSLRWSAREAVCSCCQRSYPRREAFWDFAPDSAAPAPEVP